MAWKCPIWHFYAADRGASPAALHRVRRQDSVAIRARHDDARDPGTSGRDLWRGSVAVADFLGHGRGDRGSEGVAEPAIGAAVSDPVSGCADGEDAAREAGGEPGRV